MLMQRAFQQSLRRSAFQTSALSRSAVNKFSPPAILAASSQLSQKRYAATTEKMSQDEGYQVLVQQRLKRPVSPHLGIYELQVQMICSSLNRITGCILSGGFYIFGFSYLVAPYVGLHMESTALVAAFGAWPVAAKIGLKSFFAWPFVFHCVNGVRHLVWDTARLFGKKEFVYTSHVILGVSTLLSGYLAFFV